MLKTKNKPGIHLFATDYKLIDTGKPEFYGHIVARNGRIIARSSETYTRKSGAVKSIRVAAEIFRYKHTVSFYDHSKPDSPLTPYV